ncbi:helix-turn-helix transcriptional regulator [Streptomyces sp. WP-1]|uniref:helix-turn-helix domain-containing protein n=1 Tax=Streptomyces sp. WP-1 TaxID=3041497 RepID=UPI002649BAC8|nr:helix-turn-helix transcriptional regulator [Streptomyces sp. WP-1]WKE73010.1 helix-turn-helix transcriptional regulator [Streptomyces sp. WP-1]
MSDTRNRPLTGPTHIGVVLERVRRQAGVQHEILAHRTGVGADYLARVLGGACFPPRRFILLYARTCGADPQVLLRVWEDEHERLSTGPDQGRGGRPPSRGA